MNSILFAEENYSKYYFGAGSSDGKGEIKEDMAKKTSKKQIEQYEHSDKERANNPHVGLVTSSSDPDTGAKKKYKYDPHLDPQLQWAGKTEHTSFEVPTVSLVVTHGMKVDKNNSRKEKGVGTSC